MHREIRKREANGKERINGVHDRFSWQGSGKMKGKFIVLLASIRCPTRMDE